ncbi:hypothetical protein AVEN_148778-1 [Araneus ventricosus]|uniref:Uncharacterized protein n=1 Tax=Araneus ventricosus TaxID=182803 RepID=A0A4Y2QZW2_ARAVE|nr:hypothetical protein AVEN_148778-1 [Araneus ventricosus]
MLGDFYINQIIAGHGSFKTYQIRFFGKSPWCFCGKVERTMEHLSLNMMHGKTSETLTVRKTAAPLKNFCRTANQEKFCSNWNLGFREFYLCNLNNNLTNSNSLEIKTVPLSHLPRISKNGIFIRSKERGFDERILILLRRFPKLKLKELIESPDYVEDDVKEMLVEERTKEKKKAEKENIRRGRKEEKIRREEKERGCKRRTRIHVRN